jgi:methanogenic corrinoid protein MtbC1
VLVGGAPVDRAFADKIGADGYGSNAAEAVELSRRFASAK